MPSLGRRRVAIAGRGRDLRAVHRFSSPSVAVGRKPTVLFSPSRLPRAACGQRCRDRLGDQPLLVSPQFIAPEIQPVVDPKHARKAGGRPLNSASDGAASDAETHGFFVGNGDKRVVLIFELGHNLPRLRKGEATYVAPPSVRVVRIKLIINSGDTFALVAPALRCSARSTSNGRILSSKWSFSPTDAAKDLADRACLSSPHREVRQAKVIARSHFQSGSLEGFASDAAKLSAPNVRDGSEGVPTPPFLALAAPQPLRHTDLICPSALHVRQVLGCLDEIPKHKSCEGRQHAAL